MAQETTLIKRPALYKGEIGLFAPNQMAEEDLMVAPMHSEVLVGIRSEANLQLLKFIWAIAWKLAKAGRYLDKDEGMDDLCIRAAHSKLVFDDKTKKLELRRRSLRRQPYEVLRKLADKVVGVVLTEVLPGTKHNEFINEIEEMIGGPIDVSERKS